MRDDEEAVQHAEGDCWDCEEVHRGNCFAVVAQEGCPSPGGFRTSRRSAHPSQDGALRDVQPEHLQLTVDSWRAPGGGVRHHTGDEFAHRFRRGLYAGLKAPAGEPLRVLVECGVMPACAGGGLENDQRVFPPRPAPPQGDPEEPVMGAEARARMLRRKGSKLLTKCEVLQDEVTAGPKTAT